MECANRPESDYHAAAEQLLVVLSSIAGKFENRPLAAIKLVMLVFERDVVAPWSHETRRRRVREVATIARQLLAQRQQAITIAADGRGYWLTGDAATIAAYAARRRRQGLRDLHASKQANTAAASVGQASLFPEPEQRIRY